MITTHCNYKTVAGFLYRFLLVNREEIAETEAAGMGNIQYVLQQYPFYSISYLIPEAMAYREKWFLMPSQETFYLAGNGRVVRRPTGEKVLVKEDVEIPVTLDEALRLVASPTFRKIAMYIGNKSAPHSQLQGA